MKQAHEKNTKNLRLKLLSSLNQQITETDQVAHYGL